MTTVNVPVIVITANRLENLAAIIDDGARGGDTVFAPQLREYARDLMGAISTTGSCDKHGEHDAGDCCPACKVIDDELGGEA